MPFLSPPRRPRRPHEWSAGKIVTFIVTLAATRSVTLAARGAGMSRKSAYALKGRDPAFASAWNAALKVRQGPALSGHSRPRVNGDKVNEVYEPRFSYGQGDSVTRVRRSNWSTAQRHAALDVDAWRRDLFFSRLARLHRG